jgi:lysozyme
MAVNQAALDLIMEAEGFVPNWYPDPAHGWKVPTCCYGHTDAAGAPLYADTKGKTFTKAEGRAILLNDLEAYARDVRSLVKVPLNENQHGALTSFTYNLGKGNLAKSTLLKRLNAGDYAGAAAQFGQWINAGGKPLPGLIKRREAERQLFLTPAAGAAPLPIPDATPKPDGLPAWLIIAALAAAALAAFFFVKF